MIVNDAQMVCIKPVYRGIICIFWQRNKLDYFFLLNRLKGFIFIDYLKKITTFILIVREWICFKERI